MVSERVTTGGRAPRPAPARWSPALMIMACPAVTYLLVHREGRALLAACAAVLVLFITRRPATALPLLIPVGLAGAALPGGSFGVLATVALLFLATVFRVMAGGLALRAAHLWIALLAAVLLASYLVPPATITTVAPGPADFIGLMAGLAVLAVAAAAPPRPRTLARVIAVAGAVAAGYALAAGTHESGRLAALGLNTNYLGALLALPFVAAIGLVRRDRNPVWLVPAGVCLVAMAGTQSRGAFLAAAAGAAVVLVQGRPVRVQAAAVLAAVVTAVALPGCLGAAERLATGDRRTSELSANSQVRRHAAEFAARVAVEHPLRGIGYGRFPSYAARTPRFGLYIAPHNDYLRLAAETGAVALTAFLALLWLGARGRRRGGPAVLRAVVITYAVGLFFADPLANLAASLPFWLSLGCLLATPPDAPAEQTESITSVPITWKKAETDA